MARMPHGPIRNPSTWYGGESQRQPDFDDGDEGLRDGIHSREDRQAESI